MENAAKALTMAGSVLIALVIIGAILLVFNNLNSYQKVNDQLEKDEKVLEFNNQFETYNRTDIRGSDLLSLINRVIDYNDRQSYEGREGKDLGYKPIILTINLEKSKKEMDPPLTSDDSYTSIFRGSYTISKTTNEMQSVLDIIKGTATKKGIEKIYTQTELSNLVTKTTSIFLSKNETDERKEKAVEEYNNILRETSEARVSSYSELAPGTNIRKMIYNYYEYVQFKRSYFDCISEDGKSSGVKYDDNGRITEMYFVGNGKVE